ncbi:hypothetical protein CALCODRAFT_479140 [Calocera cornea HHB12733]|uniref:Tim44-like domain-containing protein n=1 Tax=Calocera cornea HHB12733 TaxID=1353952 RepID=A0A165K1V4_9BASI|nr:hypothetical protein CALCODRAFT_479140 [Calocera cornea HHB12733]
MAEAERLKKEMEDIARKQQIAMRRDNPFNDPMMSATALPMMTLIPPVSWSSLKGVGIRGRMQWVWDQLFDPWANHLVLKKMAREGVLPFTDFFGPRLKTRFSWLTWWPTTQKPWTEALRKRALDMYIKVNETIASGSAKALIPLCHGEYLDDAFRRQRAYGRDASLEWKFHGEASPTRVLSIRDVNVPTPKGEFFLTHVLMRFDTMQSLTVRKAASQKGHRHGTPVPVGPPVVDTPPKRVTEYIVLEGRRMDGEQTWKFRFQMYDDAAPYLPEGLRMKKD